MFSNMHSPIIVLIGPTQPPWDVHAGIPSKNEMRMIAREGKNVNVQNHLPKIYIKTPAAAHDRQRK